MNNKITKKNERAKISNYKTWNIVHALSLVDMFVELRGFNRGCDVTLSICRFIKPKGVFSLFT